MNDVWMDRLAQRTDEIRRRIAVACGRCGRDPSEVRIVAVSKTFPPEAVAAAFACGLRDIGENRVQEALAKMPLTPSGIVWHMIGHLQRNKVHPAARAFQSVDAVDSLRLAEALERACDEAGVRMPVLLEVNVAGEGSKFGLRPDEVPGTLREMRGFSRLEPRGLLAIPPPAANPEQSRPHFRRVRELRDQCEQECGAGFPELSMGMSGDFEVAVEEGATMVRLGTVLFGQR